MEPGRIMEEIAHKENLNDTEKGRRVKRGPLEPLACERSSLLEDALRDAVVAAESKWTQIFTEDQREE